MPSQRRFPGLAGDIVAARVRYIPSRIAAGSRRFGVEVPAPLPLVEVSEIAREAGYDVRSGQLHDFRARSADLSLHAQFAAAAAHHLDV